MNVLSNISNISRKHYHYLFTFQNVSGVGVGYKVINGICTNELCIHVLVEKKINNTYLTSNNRIPKTYMGIKTDVIEIGTPKLLGEKPKIPGTCRPLQGGCSIYSKGAISDGTLGCIVMRKKLFGTKYFILSNNHVLANTNKLKLGTKVLQPSIAYGGIFDSDVVARLSEFRPISFPKGIIKPKNFTDCAIAEISSKSLISNKILEIGQLKGYSNPTLNAHVRKVGFVSGLTDGKITTINTTIDFYINGAKVFFADQAVTSLLAIPGDSGSVAVNDDNKVVGLLFASNSKGIAFMNDINLVLKELNVEIYT